MLNPTGMHGQRNQTEGGTQRRCHSQMAGPSAAFLSFCRAAFLCSPFLTGMSDLSLKHSFPCPSRGTHARIALHAQGKVDFEGETKKVDGSFIVSCLLFFKSKPFWLTISRHGPVRRLTIKCSPRLTGPKGTTWQSLRDS